MDFEELKKLRNRGFIKEIGFAVTEIREGYAKGELKLEPMHRNPIGSTHGGVLFSIADTVAGTAATSRGRFVTTLSGNINYLRPAMNCEKLIAESREIKVGKKVGVYEVTICNEKEEVLAVATMTFSYFDKEIRLEKSDDLS